MPSNSISLFLTFQKMIETAGGQYLNAVSAAQGRIKSFTATVELSSKGIYTKGPKSLTLQMMELFDPITGKTGKDFGKSRKYLPSEVKLFLPYLVKTYHEIINGV